LSGFSAKLANHIGGYPDGLCAENMSDVVRILTISDIFSALIEDRRYKRPMPREDAYDILRRMQGKLEKALVNSFRQVALNR
jgi:HD-GYP domain-containing protein (c-di-GMP phosphodiesterase class II)